MKITKAHSAPYPFLLFFAVLLQLLPGKGFSQSFECIVNYDSVTIGTPVSVAFTFTGNTDSIKPLAKPFLQGFSILEGPHQSATSNMARNAKDELVTTQSTTISYKIAMQKAGTVVIPAEELEMKNGTKYRTKPVSIFVSAQPISPHTTAGNKTFTDADSIMMMFKNEDWGYMHAISKMNQSAKPNILITGITYQSPDATKEQVNAVLKNAVQYLKTVKGVTMIDSFKGELTRLYFEVQDTARIREKLQAIYDKPAILLKTQIIFTRPHQWGINDELQAFKNENHFWKYMYGILDQVPAADKRPDSHAQIHIRFYFKDNAKMQAFIAFAAAKGYRVTELKDKRKYESDNFFADLSKDIISDDNGIIDAIQSLRIPGTDTDHDAVFGSFTLDKN